MNQIPLDQLLKKVDSRYSLVVAAAKRARVITGAGEETNKDVHHKAVSVALGEIMEGKIKIKIPKR